MSVFILKAHTRIISLHVSQCMNIHTYEHPSEHWLPGCQKSDPNDNNDDGDKGTIISIYWGLIMY